MPKIKYTKKPGYVHRNHPPKDSIWYSMALSGCFAAERVIKALRKYMEKHHPDVQWMSYVGETDRYATFSFNSLDPLNDDKLQRLIEEESVLSILEK